tara:strand:- start:427 stop:534 length:108 start_codon:yes stop_codon:yes gene_type:complete
MSETFVNKPVFWPARCRSGEKDISEMNNNGGLQKN